MDNNRLKGVCSWASRHRTLRNDRWMNHFCVCRQNEEESNPDVDWWNEQARSFLWWIVGKECRIQFIHTPITSGDCELILHKPDDHHISEIKSICMLRLRNGEVRGCKIKMNDIKSGDYPTPLLLWWCSSEVKGDVTSASSCWLNDQGQVSLTFMSGILYSPLFPILTGQHLRWRTLICIPQCRQRPL